MRALTLYVIPAAALTIAACGGDSSAVPCSPAPTCSLTPAIVAATATACGTYNTTTCQTDQSTTCHLPVVPVAPGAQEVVRAPHTVGEIVTFNVPPNTAGFSIVQQVLNTNGGLPALAGGTVLIDGQPISNVVVPDQVRAPNGELIYTDVGNFTPDPSGLLAFYGSDSPWTGAFTIPNTTPMLGRTVNGIASGAWQFTVNDYVYECPRYSNCKLPTAAPPPGQYEVSVVLRPGSRTGTGTVDVGVYLVGVPSPVAGTNLTAQAATTDPGFKRMVSTLTKLYGDAGICIGKVTVYEVPAWAQTAYGTLNVDDTSPCSPLNQMFTLSAPENQLNFFYVNALTSTSSGGGQIVGIDGTIPGPSAYGGTIHSGAAVNGSNLQFNLSSCVGNPKYATCGPDEVAYITAHEGGHWLGLYHTTERHGDSFDTLADTAKCPCSLCAAASSRSHCSDANSSTRPFVDDTMCVVSKDCAGGDDLMFWQLGNASQGKLSCEQGSVMRANPAVH